MAQYRKKPVVIEAIQWTGHKLSETPEWITEAMNKEADTPGFVFRLGAKVEIYTLEGIMYASPGDYIIRGVNGELYPCKPEIFEKTYEPA